MDLASITRERLTRSRSEEHTSELQSQSNLVCRLLLEKQKIKRRLLPAGGIASCSLYLNYAAIETDGSWFSSDVCVLLYNAISSMVASIRRDDLQRASV